MSGDEPYIDDVLISEWAAQHATEFETTTSPEFSVWFVDYNRIIGDLYSDFTIKHHSHETELRGHVGSSGIASGRVRIANDPSDEFHDGEVLVCHMTTPAHLQLMRHASAIVTEQGGILTHAAIVARELKIPCITGVKDATKKLHNGELITVDAVRGVIDA